ncbi:MAG: ribosome silencing factor [Prevotellaceae bacterium]|nr:ribosome silencing factor [Prevotellaceae bacterium]
MTETEKLVQACVAGIQEKKGKKIRVVNLENIDDTITKYLVIGEGNSPSQVAALTDSVKVIARRDADSRPTAVDGTRNNLWVAIDYTDVVVHIFVPDAREFYDVDHLWEDAEITDIPDID